MWDGLSAVPQDTPISAMSLLADPEYGRATGRAQGQPGAFSAPTGGSYGLLDFAQLNPWTGILAQREADAAKKPVETVSPEEERRRRDEEAARRTAENNLWGGA